ncbi:MAG: transmembrane 220 family protein [Gammaproteobacteria bacterium]
MKATDYLLAIMLAVIAIIQINDPDPVYWVGVYGLASLVALLNAFDNRKPFLAAMTVGMIVSGLIYAAPGFVEYLQAGDFEKITASMDGPDKYVEPAREFIGLLIALSIVISYPLRWRANP